MELKKQPKHTRRTAKNLGDFMKLESADADPSSSQKNSAADCVESVRPQNDLGNLIGLGPPIDANGCHENTPVKRRKARLKKYFTKNISAQSTQSPSQFDGMDTPVLWMLTPNKFPFALESFRALKNKVTALKENENLSIFLITGASRKVGGSTVTFNLAITLGMDLSEKRLLLVDANLEHPSLDKAFNISPSPGLKDHIFEGRSLQTVLQEGPLPNLDLLSVGKSSQLISPFDTEEFSEFIEDVKTIYDVVLFDSAPALHSSQTRLISAKADGVIIVVEANSTRWEVVSELKRQLEIESARIVGSFLNKRIFVIPKWVYRFI